MSPRLPRFSLTAVLVAALAPVPCHGSEPPDLILHNGRVITVDSTDRAADGAPTGVLKESAQSLVKALIPKLTREQEEGGIRAFSRELSAEGMTGFKDPGISAETFATYQKLAAEGA